MSPQNDVTTVCLHGGFGPDRETGAILPPIHQTTTYVQPELGHDKGYTYSRCGNPTVELLEKRLMALEGASEGLAFKTGMAAIATLFLATLRAGDRVMVSEVAYGGTVRLLREILEDFDVTADFVDTTDLHAIDDALALRPKVALIETPANPTLTLTDIAALASRCRQADTLLCVDNTFLTPVLQSPLRLGAHLALYSTTKAIEGHNATVGGAILGNDPVLFDRLRHVRKTLGNIQAPFEAWLTLQGLKTLPLRLERQSETALAVARHLERHAAVRRVHYPFLDSFPQRELSRSQQRLGGGLLAFELIGGSVSVPGFLKALKVVSLAENLGSVESLVTHPATMTHASVPLAQRERTGITDGLIRLSLGLEALDDVLSDLDQALAFGVPSFGDVGGPNDGTGPRCGAPPRSVDAEASPITVLKFGSSVLRTKDDLSRLVHEIYRYRRAGHQVLAVVSAIGETTDRLAEESRAFGAGAGSGHAALLATGERRAVALLGLALERAGIPAAQADDGALGLRCLGDPCDATPLSFREDLVRDRLDRFGVLLVPGFVGRSEENDPVLMGRGGSDLTALFLAERLGAQCVLVKDVDGLYERDPSGLRSSTFTEDETSDAVGALSKNACGHRSGRALDITPRRFETVSFEDALALDGRILQKKALRFALERGFQFRVGALGESRRTLVGASHSAFADVADARPPLGVALLGLGTVGGGVAQLLQRLAADGRVRLLGALVRDESLRRPGLESLFVTTDADALFAKKPDIVVESLLGIDPARGLVERALRAGAHVVTANKVLIAEHGEELTALARSQERCLRFAASVGGVVPVLEAAARAERHRPVLVEGVLNGTSSYLFERMSCGVSFLDAVVEAQALGYAEADPTADLSGADLVAKGRILARRTFSVEPDLVSVVGLSPRAETLTDSGPGITRLVLRLVRDGERVRLTVGPVRLRTTHPLGRLRGVENGVRFVFEGGRELVERGSGAGRWPTAEAVVADVLDLADAALDSRNDVAPAALIGEAI